MDTHSENKPDGSGGVTAVYTYVAVVLILYVGSIGPVARFYDRLPSTIQTKLEYFYAPLIWANDAIPGGPMEKYVELWLP